MRHLHNDVTSVESCRFLLEIMEQYIKKTLLPKRTYDSEVGRSRHQGDPSNASSSHIESDVMMMTMKLMMMVILHMFDV